jgi:hypothetical protein
MCLHIYDNEKKLIVNVILPCVRTFDNEIITITRRYMNFMTLASGLDTNLENITIKCWIIIKSSSNNNKIILKIFTLFYTATLMKTYNSKWWNKTFTNTFYGKNVKLIKWQCCYFVTFCDNNDVFHSMCKGDTYIRFNNHVYSLYICLYAS